MAEHQSQSQQEPTASRNKEEAGNQVKKPAKSPIRWGKWLWVTPIFFLILSAWLQTDQIIARTEQIPVEQTAVVQSQQEGMLVLHIAYPPELERGGMATAKAPISIWLSYASLIPSSTTIPKQTSTATPTPDPSSAVFSTPSASLNPTATPYILFLDVPSGGLTFTDKDGQPLPAQIALTPAQFAVTPAVLFVQVNPKSNKYQTSDNIIPFIRTDFGPQWLSPIPIAYESKWWAEIKLFGSLVLTPTAIGSLLLAIASLAVQQWSKIDEERRSKEKSLAEVEKDKAQKTENILRLIKENPAEAARQYREFRKTISNMEFLDAAWNNNAPEELKNLVKLESSYNDNDPPFEKVVAELGKVKIEAAIKLAIQHRLDEDWESRAAAILQNIISLQTKMDSSEKIDGQLLQLTEQRTRESVLKVWPNISYWRLVPPNPTASFDEKMVFFEQAPYPFGAPRAEENIWLFDGRFDGRYGNLESLKDIERINSVIITGPPGWGKTTTALWLLDDALRSQTAFPIYISASSNVQLTEIATIIAKTVMHYLAINPSAFMRRGMAGKASMAHLLVRCLDKKSNLTLLLREAGLPQTGDGLNVEQELQRLTKGYLPQANLTESDILTTLSESYPDGFYTTWLLFDIQNDIEEKDLEHLFELIVKFNQIGLKTKVFLSHVSETLANMDTAPIPVRLAKWNSADLNGLITVRLQRLGEESLSALCQPELRWGSELTPEERLVAVSNGKPGILVQKSNQLLKRISQKKDLLCERDFDEILGPISKNSAPRQNTSEAKQ